MFVSAYLRNKENIEDLVLVPVTFNYDKVYEMDAFPYELLGEQKPKDNIFRLLKHVTTQKQKLGKVVIKYCKPVSMKQFLLEYANRNNLNMKSLT
mmetsp:Transcript_22857/g.17316  ORF Transcript_22857/g.17316 Transcript_22857/m.17316 type:complete len:95 (+) Transcript_22857:1413-1697(+)